MPLHINGKPYREIAIDLKDYHAIADFLIDELHLRDVFMLDTAALMRQGRYKAYFERSKIKSIEFGLKCLVMI
ncbi:hypothetical protein QEO94_10255 [Kingella negevensis]|uniref:hypothetical protein n=1 Tax=Kingella negevensis TaxID=1522312 RepID=UPI002542A1F2|nr:hypothetical protein [Kingella negevensis]WII92993.1 hypothetical protein QEO94_10255 [Kingella negevensis]